MTENTYISQRLVSLLLLSGLSLNGCGPAVEGDATPISPEKLDGRQGRDLALYQFRPIPMLKTEAHQLTQAKFPAVDVHTHMRYKIGPKRAWKNVASFVEAMDRNQIAICVSLNGGLGDDLDNHLKSLWRKHRERIVVFANIDWRGDGDADDPTTWDCQRPDFARRIATALERAKKQGASGLKLFRSFGLEHRNSDGSLIAIDDRRWDPIWEACGRAGLVVLIHTADPTAFFEPIDERNERWEELHRHPEWSFYGDAYPSRAELLAALRVSGCMATHRLFRLPCLLAAARQKSTRLLNRVLSAFLRAPR